MKTRFLKQKHNFFSPPPELMVVLLAFYLASKEHSVLKIDIKLGNGLLQAINFFFNRKKWIIFYRIFISWIQWYLLLSSISIITRYIDSFVIYLDTKCIKKYKYIKEMGFYGPFFWTKKKTIHLIWYNFFSLILRYLI